MAVKYGRAFNSMRVIEAGIIYVLSLKKMVIYIQSSNQKQSLKYDNNIDAKISLNKPM